MSETPAGPPQETVEPIAVAAQVAPPVETAHSSVTEATGVLTKTPDDRKAILDRELQQRGAAGWRIETRSDFQATIAKGKPVNHILHLILTLVTLGVWGIVWILMAILGGVKRVMMTVDEFGNTVATKI